MLAAITERVSIIEGYSTGAGRVSTDGCLRRFGVASTSTAGPRSRDRRSIGRGPLGRSAPAGSLDAGNSGSTVLIGVTPEAGRSGEPAGTIRVRHRAPVPARIEPDEVPGVSDEWRILGVPVAVAYPEFFTELDAVRA